MSDQYSPATPMPARPTIAGAGLDPYRADTRMGDGILPPLVGTRHEGGFSTGLLVAIVFVVVAIMAAAVFSNREVFGIGLGVTPVSAPVDQTGDAAAPAGSPAIDQPAIDQPAIDQPAPVRDAPIQPTTGQQAPVEDAPAQPAPAPVQAPAANP